MDHKWNGSLDHVPKPASPVNHTWEFKTGTTQSIGSMYGTISSMGPVSFINSSTSAASSPSPIRGGRRKTFRRRNRKSYKKSYKRK